MQLEKAQELVSTANKLISAKGKKVTIVDLKKEQLTEEQITKLMIGPTGNLRAPTLVKGKTVIVGFDEETYEQFLT